MNKDVRVASRARILLIFLKRLVPALPRRFFFARPPIPPTLVFDTGFSTVWPEKILQR